MRFEWKGPCVAQGVIPWSRGSATFTNVRGLRGSAAPSVAEQALNDSAKVTFVTSATSVTPRDEA